MKTRIISGVAYVLILLVTYMLKVFLNDLFFDVLIYFCSLVGTWEITRAVGDKLTRAERILIFAFAAICVPAVAVAETYGYGVQVSGVCFSTFAVATLCLTVVKYEETNPENVGLSFFCAIYPTLMLVPLVLANHIMESATMTKYAFNSNLAILMIFVVSPMADAAAYFTGCFLGKKFPKKMAAAISPKKTMVGAIGGVVGGIIGSIGVYFVYNALFGSFDGMASWIFVYAVTGALASLATEFGDLVESGIKRKLGIKDMGKIMPGHGGVLDRIDGTLFATIAVYFTFIVVFVVTSL